MKKFYNSRLKIFFFSPNLKERQPLLSCVSQMQWGAFYLFIDDFMGDVIELVVLLWLSGDI